MKCREGIEKIIAYEYQSFKILSISPSIYMIYALSHAVIAKALHVLTSSVTGGATIGLVSMNREQSG